MPPRRCAGSSASRARMSGNAASSNRGSFSGSAAYGATSPLNHQHGEQPSGHSAPMFADANSMKQALREQMIKPAYDVSQYYWETGCARRIATHPLFEAITLVVISLNALWISIDTDHNKATTLIDAHPVFQFAENCFCLYFFTEWLIRFLAFKKKCNGLRDAWFVFDSCLVSLMVVETWVFTILILSSGSSGSGGLGNASILRMARLLRLSRMARMARLLRAMPELLILIKGMAAAMRSVMFTLFLLVAIIYIFAIAFRQLSDGTDAGSRYFKTVPFAMATLLHRGTFMDEFNEIAETLANENPALLLLLYIFVLIGSLTLMNMLIGVLVDVVQAVASTEKEALTMGFVKEKMQLILHDVGIDIEHDEKISRSQFLTLLSNSRASRTFLEVDVDPMNLVDAIDFIFHSEEVDEYGDSVDKQLSFGDLMEVVLALRGTNTATVRDIVDLRKFIQKELKVIKDIGKRAAGLRVSMAGPESGISNSAFVTVSGGSTWGAERPFVATDSGTPIENAKLAPSLDLVLLEANIAAGQSATAATAGTEQSQDSMVSDESNSSPKPSPKLDSNEALHPINENNIGQEPSDVSDILAERAQLSSSFAQRAEILLQSLTSKMELQHQRVLDDLAAQNRKLLDGLSQDLKSSTQMEL